MEEIKYPLFLFENISENDDKYKLGGSMQGMFSSIESLITALEPWQIKEDLYKLYDAQGKLLILTVELRKVKEKSLFNTSAIDREFVKVSIGDDQLIRADLLKKFLQINLLETIKYIKEILENHELNRFELKIETGLFGRMRKIIKNEFLKLVFVDNNVINIKFDFFKLVTLDFFNNILKNNLIEKFSLLELSNFAGQLWVYNDTGSGVCIQNQL